MGARTICLSKETCAVGRRLHTRCGLDLQTANGPTNIFGPCVGAISAPRGANSLATWVVEGSGLAAGA